MVDKPRIKKDAEQDPDEAGVVRASLTDEQVAEFQRLYKEHYGIELTKEQAFEKGLRLVRLLKVVLQATAEHNATNSSN